MRISFLSFIVLVAFGLCACNGSESTPMNAAAPVTPLANSTVTPYQQPTANKRASASPTPCVGKYIEPGENGAPDEIRPCPTPDDMSPANTAPSPMGNMTRANSPKKKNANRANTNSSFDNQ
jgi:hypothetical protein